MNICSIMPKGAYEYMYDQPMVMLLTHLVEKDPAYVQLAHQHPNTYKILDNSLIELGDALSMERLVNAAERINADEIIIPDVFRDGPATVQSAKESIQWLIEHGLLGKYKIMAVAHGTTYESFKECFDALNAMPEIDVIGIPKVMSSFAWVANRSRASLYDIFKDSVKTIHFLGSWYQLGELLTMPKEVYKKVRSCDTCLFALDVIQGIDFYTDRSGTIDLEHEYPELTRDAYNKSISTFMESLSASQEA